MELKQLSPEEIAILDNSSDTPLIEIINSFSFNELKQIDDAYIPLDFKHYMSIQKELWMEKEKYLIGKRPGHSSQVTSEEIIEDMYKYNNSLRYKVWYVLKFPEKIKRKNILEKII